MKFIEPIIIASATRSPARTGMQIESDEERRKTERHTEAPKSQERLRKDEASVEAEEMEEKAPSTPYLQRTQSPYVKVPKGRERERSLVLGALLIGKW